MQVLYIVPSKQRRLQICYFQLAVHPFASYKLRLLSFRVAACRPSSAPLLHRSVVIIVPPRHTQLFAPQAAGLIVHSGHCGYLLLDWRSPQTAYEMLLPPQPPLATS
jgi:hypothetical protein|eukprot:SAG25_NODE_3602_length_1025_cov_1.728942_2_plen_107_part_00